MAAWAAAGVFVLVATHTLWSPWWLIFNRTPSLPTGWYWVDTTATPALGEIVLTRYRQPDTPWAHRAGIPDGYRILKEVRAAPGDTLRIDGHRVLRCADLRDCEAVAERNPEIIERLGIPPLGFTETVLAPGHYFLATDYPRGWDSRYLGPVQLHQAGRARPVTFNRNQMR